MGGEWSFRTESGLARVTGGDLRVERSASRFLQGWFEHDLRSEDRFRAAWNVVKVPLLFWTIWRFAGALVDGVQPGPGDAFAILVVGLFTAAVAYRVYRDVLSTTRVPLASIERAVIDRDESTLTLVRTDGETEVDLRTREDADAARERLALKGVSVEMASEDGSAHTGDDGRSDTANERAATELTSE